MPATNTPATTTCPNCGTAASGHFCANCGAPLQGALCAACRTPLTAAAKFCHRCGTAVGAVPAGQGAGAGGSAGSSGGFPAALPWTVAGIALLALIALVAGQRFNARPVQSAEAAPEGVGAVADGGDAAPAQTRAPDISSLSPRERADRLYDRIMRLDSEGKKDSAAFFSQMGIAAYQMLPQQDLDSRYDMGRIAEVAGALPFAKAQADSILAADPNHLLGLLLAISTARDAGDQATAKAMQRRLVAAEPAELAKKLPEYERHQAEITAAVQEAKKQQ